MNNHMRSGAKGALALAALLAISASAPAFAETSASSTRPGPRPPLAPGARAEMRAEFRLENASTTRLRVLDSIREKREEILKDWKERKEVLRQKLSADAKVRIEKRMSNVYDRLTKHVDSVAKADVRISARISEIAASGTMMADIQALHVTAQTALAKAKVDIEATKALAVEQVNASSTSKEILKDMVKTAEESIKSAAKAYKAVLTALKPYAPKARATTTVNASVKAN